MRCRTIHSSIVVLLALAVPAAAAAQSDGAAESESSSEKEASSTTESDAQDDGDDGDDASKEDGDEDEPPESEHGNYDWKRSFGGGIEYGLFFSGLQRWNSNLLEPSDAPTFSHGALSSITLAAEASLLEGSRITAFGGFESPFSAGPSIRAVYGGLEPAFAYRRGDWALSLGAGFGIGRVDLSTGQGESLSAGLFMLRPAIEVRRYFNESIAGYGRLGWNQWLPHSAETQGDLSIEVRRNARAQVTDEQLLQEGGLFLSFGARFGNYPEHVKVVPDSDDDGFRDDVDQCPKKPEDKDGFEDDDGCPDKDNDDDGVPDDEDECPDKREDEDGWQDEDGCPDKDNDGDGIPDGEDNCPDEAEDMDGFEDEDGCPDPDNDGDGVRDDQDECPGEVGIPSENGCPSSLVTIEENRLKLAEKIEFQVASGTEDGEDAPRTEPTDASLDVLDHVAEVLGVHPELKKVRIRVHTGEGDTETKKKEAGKRADELRSYLVDSGVDEGRLETEAVGPAEPVVPPSWDADNEGEKPDPKPVSRVEMRIVERDSSAARENAASADGEERGDDGGADQGGNGDDGDASKPESTSGD